MDLARNNTSYSVLLDSSPETQARLGMLCFFFLALKNSTKIKETQTDFLNV